MRSDEFPNRHLVVFALYVAGGATKRVHTEDLAKKAHELFPQRFSWERYPEIPDKDVVRVSLVEARRDRLGPLVEGRAGRGRGHRNDKGGRAADGWVMTDVGITWLNEHKSALEEEAANPSLREHRQKDLRQLKSRVKSHPLWMRFTNEGVRFAPTLGEIAQLMRCRVDASPRVWDKRFDQLRQQALGTQQDDVVCFVDMCRAAYKDHAI